MTISTSFSCLSGVLPCPLFWDITFCLFILINFPQCGFCSSHHGTVILLVFFCLSSDGRVQEAWVRCLIRGTDSVKNLGLAPGGRSLLCFNPIICWQVGFHSLPGSCLAWADQALGSTGSMVGLMATSKRTYGKGDLPGLRLSVPLSLGEPQPTQASSGDPPTLEGSFGSASCGVTAPFLEVLVCARVCLHPPTLESLFPPFLCKSYK